MKTFKEILSEAKLTYDQAWDLHQSELAALRENGFGVRASGIKDPKTPSTTGYHFARSVSLNKPDGELRTYDLWIGFKHDNYTRINSDVSTKLTYTDGDNERTGSPRTVDEKKHKNIQAAIKYIKKLALEKYREDFAASLYSLGMRSVDEIKHRGLFSIVYRMRRYTKVNTQDEAIKFIEKLKKANLDKVTSMAMSKKLIKDL
jgi:hypothetical protein